VTVLPSVKARVGEIKRWLASLSGSWGRQMQLSNSGNVAPLSSLKSRMVKSVLSTASRDEASAAQEAKNTAIMSENTLIGGLE
jgi:hypothetical protein